MTTAVLRRSLEPEQYRAIRYSKRLADVGALASLGTVGDSFDDAKAESVNAFYKTECVRHEGSFNFDTSKAGRRSAGSQSRLVVDDVGR